jgi:carbon monoxide dehydrogenase subunit G
VIRLTETAATTLPRETAFEYIGDFANVDQWDPGVVSATKSGSGEAAVGASYDLVLSFGGQQLEMRYTITELVPGHRVALEGTGSRVRAFDVIEFNEYDDGTRITYTADIGLTGVARLFEPFMKGRLAKVGEDAGNGMRRWLVELEEAHRARS